MCVNSTVFSHVVASNVNGYLHVKIGNGKVTVCDIHYPLKTTLTIIRIDLHLGLSFAPNACKSLTVDLKPSMTAKSRAAKPSSFTLQCNKENHYGRLQSVQEMMKKHDACIQ